MLGAGGKACDRHRRASRTAGTASACCTPPPARVGGLDIGFVPAKGGLETAANARARSNVLFLLGADETRHAARPAAFVVYIGTPWRCRRPPRRRHPAGLRPIPRSPAPASIPRAGSRWPTAPDSRRAKPARTGRSCGRFRPCSARRCRSIRWRNCAPQLYARLSALCGDRRDCAGRCRRCRRPWPRRMPAAIGNRRRSSARSETST